MKAVSVIEILIIVAIAAIALFSINNLMFTSLATGLQGVRYTKALLLVEEGLEVMNILRNQSWANNIAPLDPATTYYLTLSGTIWSIATTPPALIDNVFTLLVTIEEVFRDGSNNISPSGTTLDTNTKKITVTVRWTDQGKIRSIVIPTYLTNLLAN